MSYGIEMAPPEPQPDPEQRARNIAEELAYDLLTRTGAADTYHFRLGDQAVKLTLTFELPDLKDLENLYIAVNPPGRACGCCGGSGKTASLPPRAGTMGLNEA